MGSCVDYSLGCRFIVHFEEEKSEAKFEEEYEYEAEDSKVVHSAEGLPDRVSDIVFRPGRYLNNGEENIKDEGNSNSGKGLE